jgi:hypothetical protein
MLEFMKRFATISACFVCGLTLNSSLVAQEFPSTNHLLATEPYATIIARNAFGLNPPQRPDSSSATQTPVNLPKITPNGITTLFGHPEVLFKTSGGGRPGQQAKDNYYDLSEGQIQDDIEVTHVDAKAGIVTFKNHDVVQTLPLGGIPEPTAPQFVGEHFRQLYGGPRPY